MARIPHKRLTVLRCIDLLERIEFDGARNSDAKWRLDLLRDAVREHLRAELARITTRKRRRRARS
jgi:hypothetical protein